MSDPRTDKGLRKINLWVTPELGGKLDAARDLRPMQRYIERLLERVMELPAEQLVELEKP